ncbi:MAG: ABC transporter ATP-binding protein [Aigarchaeota archaeon]|nr:ABC transporter ATP-binding protein [Candidatus Pelearchaeum maunauluense]
MLQVRELHAGYGKVRVLWGISLEVRRGEIVSLLGPNGAGKTTTLKAITGLVKPASGDIVFDGKRINGLPPHKVARLGISSVPEGRELFPHMTVYENLMMGADLLPKNYDVQQVLEEVYSLFPILKERKNQQAGTLSGGQRQMLAIGRALMSKPRLLVLDEPSTGLAPNIVARIFRVLEQLREEELTMLLVEQNALMALEVSDRAYLLETGRIAAEGRREELMADERIRATYLGI